MQHALLPSNDFSVKTTEMKVILMDGQHESELAANQPSLSMYFEDKDKIRIFFYTPPKNVLAFWLFFSKKKKMKKKKAVAIPLIR